MRKRITRTVAALCTHGSNRRKATQPKPFPGIRATSSERLIARSCKDRPYEPGPKSSWGKAPNHGSNPWDTIGKPRRAMSRERVIQSDAHADFLRGTTGANC